MDSLRESYASLGKLSFAELIVLIAFATTAVLWMTRKLWAEPLFGSEKYVSDTTVCLGVVLLLFVLPSEKTFSLAVPRIMDWEYMNEDFPWDVVLLMGGGFALATGFQKSKLDVAIGNSLTIFESLPSFFIILFVNAMETISTEFTSNVAIATITMPVLALMAQTIRLNPIMVMMPACICCSYAFCLPVATPPNAMVFATKKLRIIDMIVPGVVMNALGIIICAVWFFGAGQFILGQSLSLPDWALPNS